LRDEVVPKSKWEFNNEVAISFDDMLERSIPNYLDMRNLCTTLAARFAKAQTSIVDLGCSSGGSLEPIIQAVGKSCSYIGVEISEPMRVEAIKRLDKYGGIDIQIRNLDLRNDYPVEIASVTLSILTLQFVPIEYRQQILANVFDSTIPGGVFIIVEKILGRDAKLNDLLVDLYYELKGKNGYTEEQINSKRKSLEGILVPVTSDWNEQLLVNAGFDHVECFWRSLNFSGWIAIKNDK
jgi:tRNA (cmo5U34)-methyltransferase